HLELHLLLIPLPPHSTLFPYTTLFRSARLAMKAASLPDFSRARVLIVGDVMLDRYWFGDVNRISPEAPVAVVQVKRTEERPGGADRKSTRLNSSRFDIVCRLLLEKKNN